MTGQGGGINEARARFSAEVESALTRARRAAGEAKAQSGEFRRATGELAEQARTGRLRGVRRDQVDPTAEGARAEAEKFRNANGLPVERYPAADELLAGLPAGERGPAQREDDDFSQHVILVDADGRDDPADPVPAGEHLREPGSADDRESAESGIGRPENTRSGDDDEDFSQQRILFDATAETYRPDSLSSGLFEPSDPDNRS